MEKYEGMEDNELEDDEEVEEEVEEEEEEEIPRTKKIKKIKKAITNPVKKKILKKRPEPEQVVQRYAAFNQPQRMGIIDSETNEVIAEGEFAVFQAMAKMISDLEEIKNNLGSMMSG